MAGETSGVVHEGLAGPVDPLAPTGERWPLWDPGRELDDSRLADLARYTCADDLLAVADVLVEPNARALAALGGDVLLRRLYEHLVRWRRPYNTEPWAVGRGQRIRDPEWISRDSGTCIDLSLALASSLLYHHLRPLLLLLRSAEGVGHTLVAAPVDGLGDPHDLDLSESLRVAGVWRLPAGRRLAGEMLGSRFVVLDATLATPLRQVAFDENHRRSVDWALDHQAGMMVIDLRDVLASRKPFGRPPASTRPAIGRRLPAMPPYEPVPGHARLLETLTGRSGTVVIAGEQGIGKSRLAHHVAELRDDGCGWFLAANDSPTLIASIARCELAESGGRLTTFTRLDREGFARSGLRRLLDARSGWAVVLDNAESPTAELLRWLPRPDPSIGQQVLITTTVHHAEKWRSAGYEVVPEPLPALTNDDLKELLAEAPEEIRKSVDGRYLLVQAVRRYWRTAGQWPVAGDADVGAEWFWEKVRAVLAERPDAVDAALTIAALCPTPLPTAALEGAGFLRSAVNPLVDLGLVDRDPITGAVGMHRLFADAVRTEQGEDRDVATCGCREGHP